MHKESEYNKALFTYEITNNFLIYIAIIHKLKREIEVKLVEKNKKKKEYNCLYYEYNDCYYESINKHDIHKTK